MKAYEATTRDWEILRDKIEHPPRCIPAAAGHVYTVEGNTSGTTRRIANGSEDLDLYINMLNQKRRKQDFQRDNDETIAMVKKAKHDAESKNDLLKFNEEKELEISRKFWIFYAGIIVGAAIMAIVMRLSLGI